MKTFAAILIALSLWAGHGQAEPCRDISFETASFTVCTANPATEELRLFLDDIDGARLGTFTNLATHVRPSTLVWAMNAGMYHADRTPVGLYIENGRQVSRLVTRAGPGNFGLLPNGVLCLGASKARVLESRAFAAASPACEFATQSGPMLVINGQLHPRFLAGSESLNIRNGVGVTNDGTLVAAISNDRVNFHHFARLFRDVLDTPNALFLDGSISRLFVPGMNRADPGLPMGPMLGVIAD